jgi:hypothetical protein
MVSCLSAVLVGCAMSTHSQARFDRADITKPGFFPILPWDPYHGWDVPRIKHRKNGLESVAACNFNMSGFVSPKDLPLCRKLGLGAIVLPSDPGFTNLEYIYEWKNLSDAEITSRVKSMILAAGSNPAIKGYFITDEPGAESFPALAQAVAAVKKYAPGKLAYINLYPDYATAGTLGTSNYTAYLERYIAEVHPQFLSYDNYRVQSSMDLENNAAAAGYYRNLLAIRSVGLEHHLPYLNIVASCLLWPTTPPPSPANLLFQAYTTLAAGCRGVTWYTYFGADYPYPYAPISPQSGDKSATWGWLRDVNHQVATLAPIMSRLTSTGVFFSNPPPADRLPLLPGDAVKSVACDSPVMIGEFTNAKGLRYAMVVNLSLARSAKFTLKTKSIFQRISIVSAVDGSCSQFPGTDGFWLTAGQGVLLSFD